MKKPSKKTIGTTIALGILGIATYCVFSAKYYTKQLDDMLNSILEGTKVDYEK